MRRFLLVAVMCGAAGVAQAADMPDLPFLRGGFTEGLSTTGSTGKASMSAVRPPTAASDMKFTGADEDHAGELMDNRRSKRQSTSRNGRLGNGLAPMATAMAASSATTPNGAMSWSASKLNYTHGKFGGFQTGTMSRFFSVRPANVTSRMTASARRCRFPTIGSLRVRGGLRVGSFLPYAFVGVALGQADIIRTARISAIRSIRLRATDSKRAIRLSATDGQATAIWSTAIRCGLGIDVMLVSGLFLRAE